MAEDIIGKIQKNNALEADLRKWLRKDWKGWLERREPGHGVGDGAPDIQLLLKLPLYMQISLLIPVELKVAFGGKFTIRPGQMLWHREFAAAGGKAFFLFAEQENWEAKYCIPAALALKTKGGVNDLKELNLWRYKVEDGLESFLLKLFS